MVESIGPEVGVNVAIGVDVGGTKIAAGLVDEAGAVLARTRRETPPQDAAESLRAIGETILELADTAREQGLGDVTGVGVGAAGFVDRGRRTVRFAANLGWRDTAVADLLEAQVGMPVVVENDANAASWGEFVFGASREHGDMVCVTVGTGIGGGIVSEGRLVRGAYGIAAEVGHIEMVADGRLCGCGRRGCWEQYGSGNALVREARELAAERRAEATVLLRLGDGTPEGIQGVHVTAAAQQDDPVAVESFARIGSWLGKGLAELAAVLDPQVFVIGGGVVEAGELLLAPARDSFRANLVAPDHRPVAQVVPALLGNDAGIVGAADLARRPA